MLRHHSRDAGHLGDCVTERGWNLGLAGAVLPSMVPRGPVFSMSINWDLSYVTMHLAVGFTEC